MDEIDRMERLREMQLTEGWKLVEDFINKRITDNRGRLETCKLCDVTRHRERIEAYRSVLGYIDQAIEEGLKVILS